MRLFRSISLLMVLVAMPVLADDSATETDSPSAFKGPGSIVDRSPQHRLQMISVFVGIPYAYSYGFPFLVGGRFYQPIVHDGFIPAINDSFGIEFGADFIGVASPYWGFGGYLSVPAEAMWQFHLTKDFSAYGKLGLALQVHFGGNIYGNSTVYFTADAVAAAGVMYKITDSIVLRGELGYPGLKVGLGFPL